MKRPLTAKFGPFVSEEIIRMVCGKKIGEGATRLVYEHAMDATKVVKVEPDGHSWHNANEAQVWNTLRGTPLAKWLCPVFLFSPYGRVIVMGRCPPIQRQQVPRLIPAFLNHDVKTENWGMWNDHPVCLDYGLSSIFDFLFRKGAPGRLVKAKWPDGQAEPSTAE